MKGTLFGLFTFSSLFIHLWCSKPHEGKQSLKIQMHYWSLCSTKYSRSFTSSTSTMSKQTLGKVKLGYGTSKIMNALFCTASEFDQWTPTVFVVVVFYLLHVSSRTWVVSAPRKGFWVRTYQWCPIFLLHWAIYWLNYPKSYSLSCCLSALVVSDCWRLSYTQKGCKLKGELAPLAY